MMEKKPMILVTGAAGFIGSVMSAYLTENGVHDLILADDFSREDKKPNLTERSTYVFVERSQLFEWLHTNQPSISLVFHLGARTDTTEFNYAIHEELNLHYSQRIWQYCTLHQIPLIYASSAATYGSGEMGYWDDHEVPFKLTPLNPYGVSKNEFDKWVLQQGKTPPHWYGLKFFNVYGPNEYHKGRMASVIFHAFRQIQDTGVVRLFRSHRPDFGDGQQLRDFIYVKDVVNVCFWLSKNLPGSGLYNLGTGQARSFSDLAKATFKALEIDSHIQYIDMPADIRDTYQYFTEANMTKLRHAGYHVPFFSLEAGIDDYVRHYLAKHTYFGV